jgi:hypothetical protein
MDHGYENPRYHCHCHCHHHRRGGVIYSIALLLLWSVTVMVSQNYNINFVANGFSQYAIIPSSLSSFSQHQNRQRRQQQQQQQQQQGGGISRIILSSSSSNSDVITTSISSITPFLHDNNTSTRSSVKCSTETKSFSLPVPSSSKTITSITRKNIWYRRLGQSLKQKLFFWRNNNITIDDKNRNNATCTINIPTTITSSLDFTYEYDTIELMIGGDNTDSDSATSSTRNTRTTGIVLIHPIGVGIGRWFYQRLISSLIKKYTTTTTTHQTDNESTIKNERLVIVVPDLLGSGSACNATTTTTTTTATATATTTTLLDDIYHHQDQVVHKFPLFNISDWTEQIQDLMLSIEEKEYDDKTSMHTTTSIDQWCVITNGGCSPIALQIAADKNKKNSNSNSNSIRSHLGGVLVPVSNIILSSVPRLPFFIKNSTTINDPTKVAKSYKTLCGIPGKLFWWYACRNEGSFIRAFSEKNLVADPSNLGPTWQSNCYQTAISYNGLGKYSTFSFLAGTLQDGCQDSLDALKNNNNNNNNTSAAAATRIDIIKGADIRRNQAKSWFWQQKKKQKQKQKNNTSRQPDDDDNDDDEGVASAVDTSEVATNNSTSSFSELASSSLQQPEKTTTTNSNNNKSHETIRDYVEKNGNGGNEIMIGGRISLAHEDSDGYADAILQFLKI